MGQTDVPAGFNVRWRVQAGHPKHAQCVGVFVRYDREDGGDKITLVFKDEVQAQFSPHELFPAPGEKRTDSKGAKPL